MVVALPIAAPVAPARSSPESTRGWRHQSRAEQDAGMTTSTPTLLLAFFTCDLCTICIGPDFYEQELYIYPVCKQEVCLGDKPTYFGEWTYLKICGGCANAKRRRLPLIYRAVQSRYWTTNELLLGNTDETPQPVSLTDDLQVARIRKALHQQVLAVARFLLFLHCLEQRVPIVSIFEFPSEARDSYQIRYHLQQEKMQKKRAQRGVKKKAHTGRDRLLSPIQFPSVSSALSLSSPFPIPFSHLSNESQFSNRFQRAITPLSSSLPCPAFL